MYSNILKNLGGSREMKVQAAHEIHKQMSLNKTPKYFVAAKRTQYYTNKLRIIPIDKDTTIKMRQIATMFPLTEYVGWPPKYTDVPINCKNTSQILLNRPD